MLKLVVVAVLAVSAYAAYYEDLVSKFTSKPDSFQHGFNKRFEGYSLERIQKMMGTKLDKRPGVPIKKYDYASVPASFITGQDKWSNCAATIGYIKDQADCGSCWAVSASTVIGHRECIVNEASQFPSFLNENKPQVDFSAATIMDCCSWCGQGCQGGYPIDAMRYWCWDGVPTGGWYGSNCGCQPYQIPPCGPQGCSGPEAQTPRCSKSCRAGFNGDFNSDKHYCSDHYMIDANVNAIQQEIMNYGSIECAFTVYENFMSYTGGVYDHHEGQELGGHAVTVIGWGSSGGTPYWLINNSWNITWGTSVGPQGNQGGQFMFLRGKDLCGMESQCVAGRAKAGDKNINLQC
jgi:cathepsin B